MNKKVEIVKVKDANGIPKTYTVSPNGDVVDQNGASVPKKFASQKEACKWLKKNPGYKNVELGF